MAVDPKGLQIEELFLPSRSGTTPTGLGSCRATVLYLPKEAPGVVQDAVNADLFDGVRVDRFDMWTAAPCE